MFAPIVTLVEPTAVIAQFWTSSPAALDKVTVSRVLIPERLSTAIRVELAGIIWDVTVSNVWLYWVAA